MSTREMLVFTTIEEIEWEGKKALLQTMKSIQLPEQPETDAMLRVFLQRGGLIIKENETDTRIINIDYIDMKGWFPKYLFNWIISLAMNKNMDQMEEMFKKMIVKRKEVLAKEGK